MTTSGNNTYGQRIRSLFQNASSEVAIIAPFIKVDALQSLLTVIPEKIKLYCVTRWRMKEVAAGVSDPEILDILEARGNCSLFLVDNLHAKIFLADELCLAGSANVTLTGLGENEKAENIEILVTTTTEDPNIIEVLQEIKKQQRPATSHMLRTIRSLANIYQDDDLASPEIDAIWMPFSKKPESAFGLYRNPPKGFMVTSDRILIADLINLNLPLGLDENEFKFEICTALSSIPLAEQFLNVSEDILLTRADANIQFEGVAKGGFTTNDLWLAFVEWMIYFFPSKVMKQEITEFALRRAQIL